MELAPPPLSWKDNTPVSTTCDDVYYMHSQGLQEARYVFLQSNKLPEAWKGRTYFTIAETGFGTGLNIAALLHLWQQTENAPALHIITTEKHPLALDDITRAHAAYPEIQTQGETLVSVYPPAINGAHRRYLYDGKLIIDFLFGDAADMLQRYADTHPDIKVNAWFLDGFAPSKNADMWSESLFRTMAQMSAPCATFATFTAAGEVKRGLQAAGFTVSKTKGFAHKRDQLVGTFTPKALTVTIPKKEALVIGAGIAGISSAWHLSKQGYHITLLEKNDTICTGASGNPAAAFTPFYPKTWNPRGRVLASGFWMMRHLVNHLRANGHTIRGNMHGTLMLDLAEQSERAARLKDWQTSLNLPTDIRRNVDQSEACDLAGIDLPHHGWFYPHGGWLHMHDIAQAMLADAADQIDLHYGQHVTHLEHNATQWHIHTQNNHYTAPHVVIANAYDAATLLPELTLNKVHGQQLHFPVPNGWNTPHCVIHAGHTLIPFTSSKLEWGSTFVRHIDHSDAIKEETDLLIDQFCNVFGQQHRDHITSHHTTWAGLRCTHPSHMPLIGRVPNQSDGLYVNIAHGARGLLSGALPFATTLYDEIYG